MDGIDEAILLFLRDAVPVALRPWFAAVTRLGSSWLLVPLACLLGAVLAWKRRRPEAVLLVGATVAATPVVYGIKALVGRARPALWQTDAYWDSSFPSGHTLSTAAFSFALALCVARLRPGAARRAMGVAVAWTSLIALSRLVLGVHWPSDVLAAMGLGFGLAISLHLQLLPRLPSSP